MAICRITYDGGLAASGKTTEKLKSINLNEAMTVCSAITLKLVGEHEKAFDSVWRVDSSNKLFRSKNSVASLLNHNHEEDESFNHVCYRDDTLPEFSSSTDRLIGVINFRGYDVVTTHATLMSILLCADSDVMSSGVYLEDVDLFIDEEFNDVLKLFTISFTHTTSTLDKVADIGVWKDNPSGLDANILEITAKDIGLIELNIKSSKDSTSEVSENMGAFLKFLKDDRYIKLINKNSLSEAKGRLASKGIARFTFVAVFKVSLLMQFKSVHVAVADFPRTETALVFDYLKIDVEEQVYRNESKHPVVEGKHDNSNLIINYYSDEDWSKKLRDHKGSSSSSNTAKVAEHIRKAVGDSELIWNANVADRNQLSEIYKESNAELVIDVAGVNTYQHINNAAYMASAKLTTDYRGCLNSIGIDPEKIESARTHLRAYQFLMRSSIRSRNPDLSQVVNWYVMDKNTAMYIKGLFPNAEIKYHDVQLCPVHSDNKTGRPKGVSEAMKAKYFKAKRLRSEEKMTKKDACKAVGMSTQYYGKCKKQLN